MIKFNKEDLSRIIEMAWEDRTPFEAIKKEFNINQSQKWASLLGELRKKINYGLKVNIDPGTLVLDMVLKMNETARD